MLNEIFIILALLFVKHWYIDFVNQSNEEVASKGNYSEWPGVWHSLKHGIATTFIFLVFTFSIVDSILIGLIDFIIHYHTDWAKININRKHNYTVQDKQFWIWLGADQLIHSFTYLFLVWMVV